MWCTYAKFDKDISWQFAINLYLNSKQQDAETISEILVRAASEPEFRNQLMKEPSKVLEQYNISNGAKSVIKSSIIDLS
jgi:hypothetical protein